jgi:biotin carboxylase
MSRVLLVMQPQTYRAAAFLEAAHRIGVEVTVATDRVQPMASLAPGSSLALDFGSVRRAQQQAGEFALRYPLEAVLGVDDDTTVLAAEIANSLGLPHNSIESVKAARYKDVMRLALREAEVPSPAFFTFALDENPPAVAQRACYPCVLKPLSLSASRGVIRADDPCQFVAARAEIASILTESELPTDDPASQQILVEEFITGCEVALEGMLTNGELFTLALFDKPDILDGPYFEETVYVTPSRLPAPDQAALVQTAARAAAALGLRTGPLHAELRLNARGAWIVEVAARSIGGLCSRMLRFGEGISLEEIILSQAAGMDLGSLEREKHPSGVMMIPVPAAGRLQAVHGLAEARAITGVDEIDISIPRGGLVVPPPRATRYLGFIFAHGNTPEAVETTLRSAHSRLAFDVT